MMKSYNTTRWAAVFFISYLAINLYFLMNLMLAVVYDAFTKIEKDKFRRLFLHKRKAAQHAFKLLVTQERPEQVSFQHLEGLLTAYRPRTSKKKNICTFLVPVKWCFIKIFFYFIFLAPTEAYLIFKLINKSESGYLSLDEFYGKLMLCASLYLNSNILKWYVGWKSSSDVPEYKFAPLLIYISKVNQSAAIAEVVSKKVTRFKI